jgi:hypothetical protein
MANREGFSTSFAGHGGNTQGDIDMFVTARRLF